MGGKIIWAGVVVLAAVRLVAGPGPGDRLVAYRSFLKQPEMTRTFARMGVTTRCFFAANTVNGAGNPYCEYAPIWRGTNTFDFSAFDAQTDDLLKASPTADFLCIVDLNTPDWGVRRFWADSFHDITHLAVRDEWKRVTTHWLTNFLAHARARCGDRIRGYVLSGGGTSEWYEINQGKRSRWKDAAWRRWCAAHGKKHAPACPSDAALSEAAFEGVIYDPAAEPEKIDYWRFHNSIPADAVLTFAHTARSVLPRTTEVGVFFGYALESHDLQASFGHLDYERVFASPDIDFVISPGNYSDRDIGGGSGSQLPHGTARRYGKRLMHEIDFAPHGSPKWPTPWQSAADDLAGNTREAAFALANGCSFWWFDMWGGFYEDAALRTRISRLTEIARTHCAIPAEPVADILLVCDPQSACYVNERIDRMPKPSAALTPNDALRFRNALTRSGAVCDVVSFNDLAAIDLAPFKLVCLPHTIEITPSRAEVLRTRVCTKGRTVVWGRWAGLSDGRTLDARRVREWAGVDYAAAGVSVTDMPGGWRAVYAPDMKLYAPQVLKDLTRQAGCWTCLDECAPVFANRRFLAVHVKDGGRKTLRLKERAAEVKDLLTGEVVARDVAEFSASFASPETRLFGLTPCGCAAPAETVPYGTCAHVSRPGEFETRVAELELMKSIGIGWCRTDFDWKYVEPQKGKWTFEHLDKLLDDAERIGVTILPILDYEVEWAREPWTDGQIGLWREYVRRVVEHCKGRCPVWEVWNEPNAKCEKHKTQTPAEYVKLLKVAYEEVHRIDPLSRVAISGYANVPFDYIEGVYQAGAKPFFDIMNVHPYQRTDRAEGKFEEQFEGLKSLMSRYGDSGKSVWATEIGLMTSEPHIRVKGQLKSILEIVDAKKPWRILVADSTEEKIDILRFALSSEKLPAGANLEYCTFERLESRLAAGGIDALVFPYSEEYPADAMDAVYAFVKEGGTLVDLGGMPMFKPVRWKKTGSCTVMGASMEIGRADRLRFRFDDEYFYSDPRIPMRYDVTETEIFKTRPKGGMPPFTVKGMRAWGEGRSFRPVGLKDGDSFRPFLTCTTNGYTCTPLAWIKYDSDLKGNLLLSGYREKVVAPTDEIWQGKGCARQLNEAFAMGYGKVFWYEFQACSGFGIVTLGDLKPRPAFNAYKTFIRIRPAGSVRTEGDWRSADGDVYCPTWRRPDGALAGAVWSVSGKGTAPAVARGARSYLDWKGERLAALPDPLPDTPVYFVQERMSGVRK